MKRSQCCCLFMAAAALCQSALAQAPVGTVLRIDLKDYVFYQIESSAYSQLATDPGMPVADQTRTFGSFAGVADIVAVNGTPVKGTFVDRGIWMNPKINAKPGQAIADTSRAPFVQWHCEILQEDGTAVGSITGIGLNGGPAPPGAASGSNGGTWIVTGGTGAFLGVRGQGAFGVATVALDPRRSAVEDPVNRRIHGGAALPLILTLIPMSRPEVLMTNSGPSVTHSSDFTLVSPSKPAAAGEILSLFATGLGPVVPAVDPGQPFPSSSLARVNSPLQVTVNGEPAEVLAAVGYPGALEGYQVNFRLPADIVKGNATIQVSAAWIAGTPVNIPIQ